MEDKAEAIRQHLIEIARGKNLTTYTEAGNWVGLDMAWEVARIQIAQLLDSINEDEINQGRPMLSSLVIYKDEGRPGSGFFKCARALRKLVGNNEDNFWAKEVKAVHEWWSTH